MVAIANASEGGQPTASSQQLAASSRSRSPAPSRVEQVVNVACAQVVRDGER
jgi:hypothetical protein